MPFSMVEFIFGPVSEVFDLLFLSYLFLAFGVEEETLLINHVLQNLFGGFEVVPLPVEYFLADWLLLVVVQSVEKRMAYT